MTRKRLFWILTIAVLSMALVACGGGGADNGSNTAPAPEPAGNEAAAGEEVASAGDAAAGEPLFTSSCSACHGPDAKGMPGLGKDLTTSDFVDDMSDQELLEFVKTGRPSSDPLNTTGVDMPPKGGNPALTDDQILDIIAYLRTLHE